MQQVQSLKEKCEDLGERMRGGNIRITGSWDQAHPAVSKLQVLQMDKDVLVEQDSCTSYSHERTILYTSGPGSGLNTALADSMIWR